MQRLCIMDYEIADEFGNKKKINPVELIYSNAFNSDKLSDEFFWNFETAIDKIDDQKINLFFGLTHQGINNLQRAVKEAQRVLRTLFCGWVKELYVPECDVGYKFSGDCYFINFNYTDTLEKRFGVNTEDDFHIHGSVKDPESIIFGHSTHPETAFKELIDHDFIRPVKSGGLPRFQGLYAIEEILYQTDKHTMDRIDSMCLHMYKRGVHIEDFENIYVLGHSFGNQDLEYFKFFDKVTRCGCDYNSVSATEQIDKVLFGILLSKSEFTNDVLFDQIRLNIEYATHHRERVWKNAENLFPQFEKWDRKHCGKYDSIAAKNAVRQRFLFEQSARTREILEAIASEANVKVPEGCQSVLSLADYLDYGHAPRKKNPVWHISYFSPTDKKRIINVIKQLGQKRYILYPSIDECISNFKIVA